jgi:ribose-phosphate pyrophosphokinase
MKVLNLVYPEKSDIKYKKISYPDGQQSITLDEESIDVENIKEITIKTRLNNFLDLEIIICSVKALRISGIFVPIHLYTPYFLGSRSDRAFEIYSPNYLRDIICPIINSLKFDSVTILDPHSDVLEACLNNFRKVTNEEVVKFALSDIYDHDSNEGNNRMILISPDAGASKKIYKIAEQIEYKGDIITCSKERDKHGKLTMVNVPYEDEHCRNKDFIIIDDICDGGATFINIAKELKHYAPSNKIYLIVTHGIFSKGFEELSNYFDGIYCTNSYKDISCDGTYKLYPNGVKQLNIF